MPQLMPLFWKSSIFMVVYMIFMLLVLYYYSIFEYMEFEKNKSSLYEILYLW